MLPFNKSKPPALNPDTLTFEQFIDIEGDHDKRAILQKLKYSHVQDLLKQALQNDPNYEEGFRAARDRKRGHPPSPAAHEFLYRNHVAQLILTEVLSRPEWIEADAAKAVRVREQLEREDEENARQQEEKKRKEAEKKAMEAAKHRDLDIYRPPEEDPEITA